MHTHCRSMSVIVLVSSKSENTLLNWLQQFTKHLLGAVVSLQEQLSQGGVSDPTMLASAVHFSQQERTINQESRKLHVIMKYLNRDLHIHVH